VNIMHSHIALPLPLPFHLFPMIAPDQYIFRHLL
jgi:hypothetical protein